MHFFISFGLLPSELQGSCLFIHQITRGPSRVTEYYLMLFDEGSKGGGREGRKPAQSLLGWHVSWNLKFPF